MAIITSLLDLDYYKLTMGQFVFHRHRGTPVTYGFNNRTTSVPLGKMIPLDQLEREFRHIQSLRFTEDEIEYLRSLKRSDGTQMFRDDYLEFLCSLKLGEYCLKVQENGQLDLTFPGEWETAIFWETLALSAINELYYQQTVSNLSAVHAEGNKRLTKKIRSFAEYPQARIIEFGTRRRFSGNWQRHVLERLMKELLPEQLVGTSNVWLAKELGLRPIGTMAHELFMGIAALNDETDETLRAAHNLVLREWWDEYGEDLSIALTDTFGTEFFFRDFTPEQAAKWRGGRQDSGDPFAYGEKLIDLYRSLGISPQDKQAVFSDGLDEETIIALIEQFGNRLLVSFGWGTNLTNDLGLPALSMVIKLVLILGHYTVKLSDNLAKAQGPEEVVERYKRVHGHTATLTQKTRY